MQEFDTAAVHVQAGDEVLDTDQWLRVTKVDFYISGDVLLTFADQDWPVELSILSTVTVRRP